MKWQPFEHAGQVFDLSHLDSFEHRFVQTAEPEKPERTYRVFVHFSDHCFTQGDETDAVYPTKTTAPRSFNDLRWKLSFYLPNIIKTLMNRHVSHTDHQNFFTIEIMNENGEQFDYDVFFEVRRAENDKRLHLVVQTAFPRDATRSSSRPKSDKIRFITILHNVQNRKLIKRSR